MTISTPEVNQAIVNKAVNRFRERDILLPTFDQLRNPELIPQSVKDELKKIDPQAIHPLNLFRITWKNDVETNMFGEINHVEIPSCISGVKTKIFLLVGKYFPSGSHKIGAAYGPLVSRVTTGTFDPETQAALWPSTGNYCRGGAALSKMMDCKAIAVLPEEMSPERFNWLKDIGATIYATPGCESNVREIFEKTEELVSEGKGDVVAFNQFNDLSNPLFHYYCTGDAIREVYEGLDDPNLRLSGAFFTTGSAGTIAAGDYLKEKYPTLKLAAGEALQCTTLLNNGFGGHRIEGIGDKHVPWVHNVRNTDMAVAIDDEDAYRVLRLFNTKEGQDFLVSQGVEPKVVNQLSLLGVSSIANLIGCIKMAKYYEMDENDCLFTVATDSAVMYKSRVESEQEKYGDMTVAEAMSILKSNLHGIKIDYVEELTHYGKKRIHNLKYYTWIEQRGMEQEELERQWYDRQYFYDHWHLVDFYNKKIVEFNKATGLYKE
ncbi:hypothetical protein P9112_005351 [Eukaryota sp. TZLM1-RC]